MQSTLTLKDADPHDIFVIEPEIVRALRASKSSSNPAQDAANGPSAAQAQVTSNVAPAVAPDLAPGVPPGGPLPPVDTMFRATTADDIKIPSERINLPDDRPGKLAKRVALGLFALISAVAAAAWQHYGDTAKAAIANWVPPFVLAASPPAEKPAAEQANASAVQAAAADQPAADQAAVQPAAPPQPAPSVQSTESPAPAPASASDSAQLLQSMSHDLAAMGQQIEQLKASIEQLKAGQEQMSRDLARKAEARPSGTMASEQNLRPRTPAPPVRVTAAPARKPKPAYPALPPPAAPAYPQAAAAPMPPPAAAAPAPPTPVPQSQATADDGAPVVRPPMPLR
jgi:hypothetical protein